MAKHPSVESKWGSFRKIWLHQYISNSFIKRGLKMKVSRYVFTFFFLVATQTASTLTKNTWLSILEGTDTPIFFFKVTPALQKGKRKVLYTTTPLYCKPKWRNHAIKKLVLLSFKLKGYALNLIFLNYSLHFTNNKTLINKILYKYHKKAMALYY